ncbi:peroxiredoxin-like family protein [Umezawaea sp. Da 62-37]|uniref:peroxiredoxin-like family protein n=1 Tax=Umezawaea sp. Da 62-37 TaxID=3075927 RepID=UPI0028F6ED5D|nr:peroxiredoxin-like family protein [Umezawaea sp. Da 62-37]WNV82511.1 peroxiredoxin-like family protein [Umezawaea sp. Da 62-37]
MTSTKSTIAEQVGALQATLPTRLPAGVLTAFAAEQAAFAALGAPAEAVGPGVAMPDGALLDVHGEPTTLDHARGGGPAVVVFYRGAWCPYCNLALRTYQDQLVPELAERGVGLIAVNPQKPDGSLSMAEANDLTFTVLSDPGNGIAAALGILSPRRDPAVRDAALSLGVDVAAGNGDGTDALPMPTAVVVDAGGVIRWIDVHPDYTTRSEPRAILDAVAAL